MTTVAEFKKMLQEEISEPLDYPRVEGLSDTELMAYNEGYRSVCELLLQENDRFTESEWVRWKVATCKSCIIGDAEAGRGWLAGRRAAFAWALAELEGSEGEMRELSPVVSAWVAGEPTPAAVLAEALEPRYEWMLTGSNGKPIDGMVCIPRARYDYLLEVERQAATFAESFARWED